MSADSRTTITMSTAPVVAGTGGVPATPQIQTSLVLSDATNKVFLMFNKFGVSNCGAALIEGMPVAHHIEKFEQGHANAVPGSTQQLAAALLGYFVGMTPVPVVWLHVCGYDDDIPSVFVVNTKDNTSTRHNHDGTRFTYGVRWNGDSDITNRLAGGNTVRIAYDALNIQDAVDFSRHLIRATIDQMRFELNFPSVGGPIDTLLLIAKSSRFLARREDKCN